MQGSSSGWAKLLAWDCLLLRPFPSHQQAMGRIAVIMLLPFFFQLLWTLFWISHFFWSLARLRARGETFAQYASQHIVVSALVVAFLFYPIVAAAVLSTFNCITLANAAGAGSLLPFPVLRRGVGSFWNEDTGMRCWHGRHR